MFFPKNRARGFVCAKVWMRLAVAGLVTVFLARIANAQVREAWNKRVADTAGVTVNGVVDAGGRLHIVATAETTDLLTSRLSADGAVDWTARYSQGPLSREIAADLGVDAAGNVYVAGTINPSYDQSALVLLKYDASGQLLWATNSPADLRAVYVVALRLDPQGHPVVLTSVAGFGADRDLLTLKFDVTGELLWQARYDGGVGSEEAAALAVDGNGSIYAAGSSVGVGTGSDFVVVKYGPAGQQQWVGRYDGPTHLDEQPTAVLVDGGGRAHLVGFAVSDIGDPFPVSLQLVQFDAAGKLSWVTRQSPVPGEFIDVPAARLDSAGNILVLGNSAAQDRESDFRLQKFDSTGRHLWSARYNGAGNTADYVRNMTVDASGHAYVIGYSLEPSAYQTHYVIQKYDPAGNRIWAVERPSAGPADLPVSVNIDAAGSVLVAGHIGYPPESGQLAVLGLKYDQVDRPGLPRIVQPPLPQTNSPGGSVTFQVTASGSSPLHYQWIHNGVPIPAATNANLVLNQIQFRPESVYAVEVTNALGSTVSAEVPLVVLQPPSITQGPAGALVFLGTETTLSVRVAGLEPFTYQWRHNGTNIPGAHARTLTLGPMRAGDAGAYAVAVSNSAGGVLSVPATLRVSGQVQQTWASEYAGLPGGTELSPLLALDSLGRPVLTAGSQGNRQGGAQEFDTLTVKFQTNGGLLWDERFSDTNRADEIPVSVFVDGAGAVYVAGYSTDPAQGLGLLVLKYQADGTLLWSALDANPGWNTQSPMVVTADHQGYAYVAGSLDGDTRTLKYDLNGQVVWTNQFDRGYQEEPRAILVDEQGNPAVAVNQINFYDTDWWLVKYDSQGQEVWVASYDGDEGSDAGGVDTLLGMGRDGAGNLYLAGEVADPLGDASSKALAVVKFSSSGQQLWVSRHAAARARREVPAAFGVSAAGESWLAFTSQGVGTDPQEYYRSLYVGVIHFDGAGTRRWVTTMARTDLSSVSGLALSPAGRVFLVGATYLNSSGSDLCTVAIDPAGVHQWTVPYEGGRNRAGYGSAIAVDASGGIYAAGSTYVLGQTSDLVLVKYQEGSAPGLPGITVPPADREIRRGSEAVFTVNATGNGPLHFQWYLNGNPLAGETASTLTVRGADREDEGLYMVEVSNDVGLVRSPAASLVTRPPPTIDLAPLSHELIGGDSVQLLVLASGGAGPFRFQWYRDGQLIADATNSVLLLTNLQSGDQGQYTVAILDEFGATFAPSATLRLSQAARNCGRVGASGEINLPPAIGTDPESFLYHASFPEGVSQVDPDGVVRWNASFAGLPYALQLGNDGSVYVTGFRTGQNQLLTARYGALGQPLWSLNGPIAISSDDPIDLRVDAAGNAILLVRGTDNGDVHNVALLKISPQGQLLWRVDYREIGSNVPSEMEVDAAGNIYVTGSAAGQAITIKHAPDGKYLWDVVEEELLGWNMDLAIDPAGNVYVTSHSWRFPDGAIMTVKYDADGNRLWLARREFPAQGYYTNHRVAVDGAGNAYVTGSRDGALITLKYSSAGELIWATRLSDPPDNRPIPRQLTVDPSGNALLTFFGTSSAGRHLDIARYDAQGTLRWRGRQAGPLDNANESVQAFGAPGELYVSSKSAWDPPIRKYCEQEVAGLPSIVSPPAGRSILVGESVLFSVTATGAAPLRYQWLEQGEPVAGATNATLLLTNVYNSGAYAVRVENALGSVTSIEADLSVHVPPAFVQLPADQCLPAGSSARFEVQATGEAPLQLEWSFNGAPIPGATNNILRLSNIQSADAGVYSVRAINPFGQATVSASLTLAPFVRQQGVWTLNHTDPLLSLTNLDDVAAVSTVDAAGNVYITGASRRPLPDQPFDILTAKYDPTGALLWAQAHSAPGPASRRPIALAVDSRGYVYVSVEDVDESRAPAFGLRYTSDGQLDREFRRTIVGAVSASAVVVDGSDNVYFAHSPGFVIDKYGPAGDRLWSSTEPNGAAVVGLVVESETREVYATGIQNTEAVDGRSLADVLTAKFSAQGAWLWSRLYRAADFIYDEPIRIALDAQGNAVVTGNSGNGGPSAYLYDVITLKYDRAGTLLWAVSHSGGDATEYPVDLKIDSVGNIVVLAYSIDPAAGDRFLTLKYNPDGTLAWQQQFPESNVSVDGGVPRALALDEANNIYALGLRKNTRTTYSLLLATVKYRANGVLVWTASYDPGVPSYGNESAAGLSVDRSGSGRITISGSIGGELRDFVIVQYDQPPSLDAPVILTQPQDVSVQLGGAAVFSVTATKALRYQWQFEGVDIPGATNNTLTLSEVGPAQEGFYTVLVLNDVFCQASDSAGLTLLVPQPVIVSSTLTPDRQFICAVVVTPGLTYRFESSEDLITWRTISTVQADLRVLGFSEQNVRPARRFYRVVQSP